VNLEGGRGGSFSGDLERYAKTAVEMERLSLCRGCGSGTWRGGDFLGILRNMSGKALEGDHLSFMEAS
jgi:hypothetical protein